MTVTGWILDSETLYPLPGASAELWYNNVMLSRVAADAEGFFQLQTTGSGNKLLLSNAEYTTGEFPVTGDIGYREFDLTPKIETLEEVTVDSHITKNKKWVIPALIGLGLVVLLSDKRN